MRLILLPLLILLTGCLPKFDRTGLNFSATSPVKEKVKERVEEIMTFEKLMQQQCLSCHTTALSDPARLDRWLSGTSPEESRIFRAVESGRMPKGKPALPTNDLDIIRQRVSDYQVKEKILIPKCLQCNEKTLNDPERMAKWIIPGRPEESRLYLSVKAGRMPKNGTPLTESELKVLENYILNLR